MSQEPDLITLNGKPYLLHEDLVPAMPILTGLPTGQQAILEKKGGSPGHVRAG